MTAYHISKCRPCELVSERMATTLKSLLTRNHRELALIIGNGINKFGSAPRSNSWADLLATLSQQVVGNTEPIPSDIALTEFYDLLELKHDPKRSGVSLQKSFCQLMQEWKPQDHHASIVSWAKKNGCPILTTNFENTLGRSGDCKLLSISTKGFTDYYPWSSFYGDEELSDPCAGFGIWHVNGMERYPRSVRLGLSHYMGSVQRARGWMHRGNERLFFSKSPDRPWLGVSTWLHIVFHKPLIIFGLALEENEVFLRWLLIERARYFMKFPMKKKEAWYLHADRNSSAGKLFFLEGVGITPMQVDDYKELYGSRVWAG